MYLNHFSDSLDPLDMTGFEEFQSLCESATDLGIEHDSGIAYRSRNTVLNHQRFHFLEWGAPELPDVVLLHGGNQSAHAWDLVSLNLAQRQHVYALDQRGHGDSEWSRGAHYALTDMQTDAAAFLARVAAESQGKRPVLVGHSMGGMVSLLLTLAQPELISALVVVDIGPEVSQQGTRIIRDFVGKNIEFDDLEEFLDRVEQYDPYRSREHIQRTVKYNLIRRADGRYVSKSDRRRYELKDGNSRLPGAPTLESVAGIDLPVLVVRGGDSNVLEADAAERFVAALPKGQLVTVDGAGHNVASQNTVGFLQALTPFLAELDSQ